MMLLSRFWYAALSLAVGMSLYVVYVAVGQYNRSNFQAMKDVLASDLRVVRKELQIDSRRRLDVLLPAAVDKGIQEALVAANGKADKVPAKTAEEGRKALESVVAKTFERQPDLKPDMIFAVDHDGRVVGNVGYEKAKAYEDFELGGYPAVNDAIHGFLRDDTWVLGGKLYRVVARPVEYDVTQPPVGAIVALREVDNIFAKKLAELTQTNLVFFAAGARVSSGLSATGEVLDDATVALAMDKGLPSLESDKDFNEKGISSFVGLGGQESSIGSLVSGSAKPAGAFYSKIDGDAWALNSGFAVVRRPVELGGPFGFLSGADEQDKKSVPWLLIAPVVLAFFLIGLLLSFFEHSLPLKNMKTQAAKLKAGGFDLFPLTAFKGSYRDIATDLNAGIERVAEKGGGAPRKQADLDAILGPTPAQPSMSAFSFPGAGDSTFDVSSAVPSSAAIGPPKASAPKGPPPVAPAGLMPQKSPSTPGPIGPPPSANPPSTARTGGPEGGDIAEWNRVYEEFVRVKRQCNESVDGLTYEKFEHTLKKNRDALVARHGVKRVKFSVYVKEGRASLKATPVKD